MPDCRAHGYPRVLHRFIEQIERLLTVTITFLLGAAVATGLLAGTTWQEVLVAAAILLVVRPAPACSGCCAGGPPPESAWSSPSSAFAGSARSSTWPTPWKRASSVGQEDLWRIVGLAVIGSILVHGVTATPAMMWLDKRKSRPAPDGQALARQ